MTVTAKTLPELEIGQAVRVAPTNKHQLWRTGKCVEKLSDRSYLVSVGKETLRRNRQFLTLSAQPCETPSSSLHSAPVDDTPVQQVTETAQPPAAATNNTIKMTSTERMSTETTATAPVPAPAVSKTPVVTRTRTDTIQ